MKRWLLLFFMLWQQNLLGQPSIAVTGLVQSVNGEWLSNANVILGKVDPDSTIISSTQTDEKGRFQLTYPSNITGTLYLQVSRIGFAAQIKVLASGRPHANISFSLVPKLIVMHEVIVADKAPVKIKNDTTTYNLSQFSDGTERKVEDLLKKLPGVKVSENGTITFKGKAIDKIMLEGEDFFEKNYKLLSKNVSAALLEKIQAIENYNDENLLKGIQASDKVVLNLKFKKARISSFFGNNEISIGHPKLYNLNTTAFAFINKLKVGLLGNINNTGFDALDDAKYNLGGNDEETGNINREASPFQSPVVNELPTPLAISRSRYVINNARLVATQVNYSLSSKLKLSVYGYGQGDRRRLTNQNTIKYLLPDSVFSISETGSNQHSPRAFFGRWKLIFGIDSLSSLSYTGSIHQNDLVYRYQYLVAQEGIQEQTGAQVSQHAPHHFHKAAYIRRLSLSSAFVGEVEYRSGYHQLQNTVAPNRYSQLFGIGDVSFEAVQNARAKEQRLTVNGRWIGVHKYHSYEAGLQYAQYSGVLSSDLYLQKDAAKLAVDHPAFKNDLHYRKFAWIAEIKDELSTGRLTYTGGLVARFLRLHTQQPGAVQNNRSITYLEPRFSIRFQPNSRHKLSLQGQRTYTISGLTDLYARYILSDYRMFSRGNSTINQNAVLSIDLNWSYANSGKYFFMYLSGNYQRHSKPFVSFLLNDSVFNFSTRTPLAIINYSMGINSEISKFLPSLSSRFGFTGSYLRTRSGNFLNAALRNNTVSTTGASFYLVTAFDQWYNLDLEGAFNWNRLGDEDLLRSDRQLLRNRFFKQKISLRIQPTKQIAIKITGERFYWRTFSGSNQTQFLDALVKVVFKNPRYAFELKGLNLLDNRTIVYNNINNIVVTQNSYTLAARYLLGSFFFDF